MTAKKHTRHPRRRRKINAPTRHPRRQAGKNRRERHELIGASVASPKGAYQG